MLHIVPSSASCRPQQTHTSLPASTDNEVEYSGSPSLQNSHATILYIISPLPLIIPHFHNFQPPISVNAKTLAVFSLLKPPPRQIPTFSVPFAKRIAKPLVIRHFSPSAALYQPSRPHLAGRGGGQSRRWPIRWRVLSVFVGSQAVADSRAGRAELLARADSQAGADSQARRHCPLCT